MRDWLWRYGPTVIRHQLALKRNLKKQGHYPDPLGDGFVCEMTLMCFRHSLVGHQFNKRRFSSLMANSPHLVEMVWRDQGRLSAASSMSPPRWLIMKHLGHFKDLPDSHWQNL
jgi:hypothetical protein